MGPTESLKSQWNILGVWKVDVVFVEIAYLILGKLLKWYQFRNKLQEWYQFRNKLQKWYQSYTFFYVGMLLVLVL
jgi:hypothetical protein